MQNEKYVFDKNGLLIEIIDENENKAIIKYSGDCIKSIENGVDTLRFSYEGDFISQVSADYGRNTKYYYENDYLVKVKDIYGNVKIYSYNKYGEMEKITDVNDNIQLANNYDDIGRLKNILYGNGAGANLKYNDEEATITYGIKGGQEIKYLRDSKKRIVSIIYDNGMEKIQYDKFGNEIEFKNRNGFIYKYLYNSNRQLEKTIFPDDNEEMYRYNSMGYIRKIVNPDWSNYAIDYDFHGNVAGIRDELNRKLRFEYNKGRLEKILFPDESEIIYKYCDNSNLIEICNQLGNRTLYSYDKFSRLHLIEYSDGSRWEYQYKSDSKIKKIFSNDGKEEVFIYNKNDLLECEIDFGGNYKKYSYYTDGKIRQVKDSKNNEIDYEYATDGNLIKISTLHGNFEYIYNKYNQLIEYIDANNNRTIITYDSMGNLITKKSNDNIITYTYGISGRLVEIIDSTKDTHTKINYRYDGKIMKIMDLKNGTNVEYTYDKAGQIISKITANKKIYDYEYDINGLLISEGERNNQKLRYKYSKTGKISCILYNTNHYKEYIYDRNDNLSAIKEVSLSKNTQYDKLDFTRSIDKKEIYLINYYSRLDRWIGSIKLDVELIDELSKKIPNHEFCNIYKLVLRNSVNFNEIKNYKYCKVKDTIRHGADHSRALYSLVNNVVKFFTIPKL